MGSISTGAVFALSNTVWVGTGGMDAKIVATKDTVIEIYPNPEKYKVKGGYKYSDRFGVILLEKK